MRRLAPLVLCLAGCSSSTPAPTTIDDLVVQSRRFREILEPSLREEAESYLAPFRLQGTRHQGKVLVECRPMGGWGATYVSPDGKDERSVTEKVHIAKVEEIALTYRVVDVPLLSPTGSVRHPFEGVVAVEATTAIRKIEPITYTTADVPAGYRKSETSGGGGGSMHTPRFRAAPKGLPVVLDPEPIPPDLAPDVKQSIDDGIRRCLEAPVRTDRSLYRVKFQYDAGTRRWMQVDVPVRE